MKIHIRNMVCDRCIMAVRDIFEKHQLHPQSIELGEVVLAQELKQEQKEDISAALRKLGFELMDDKRSRIIEKIKTVVIRWVRDTERDQRKNLSVHIAEALHYEYNYLSSLFSEVEGITIEKYVIRQKIELAKELIVYDEYSLSQIADMLGYSSVAHLSSQFKQVTGITPSHFKNIGAKRRSLDKL
jgi:AraC family transcriptional regulator